MKEQYAGGTAENIDTGGYDLEINNISRAQTAAYIEDLVRELEGLAAGQHLEPLSDLLKLAKEEARKMAMLCA